MQLICRRTILPITLLTVLPLVVQAQTSQQTFYDPPHLIAYVMAVLLIAVFVLIFSNRLYVYREQEVNQRNHHQNDRLALVLRSGKVRLWTYDIPGRQYLLLSDDTRDSTIYSPIDFSKFYDADDFEQLRAAIFAIRDGQKEQNTVMLRSRERKDGEEQRHFEVKLSVFNRGKKGRPTAILGVQCDVTERVAKHERINKLLVRYHTVFNSSLVDMAYFDTDGVLTDLNAKACQTYHVNNREEVYQRHITFHQIPAYQDVDYQNIIGSLHLTSMDDQHRYYESLITPIRDKKGELNAIYVAGRDVTEMVNSFHRQQESVHRLNKATKAISEYIENINYSMDVSGARLLNYYPDRHIVEISNDLNRKQFSFTQLRCIRLAAPRDRRTVSSMLHRMDRHIRQPLVQTIQTVLRDKQGRDVFMAFNIVPMYNADGEVSHYFGMCREMTDLVYTERHLQVEAQKAQETELLKNSFLQNMSYEIRTPLNTVVGFAELFENEHDVADEPVFVEEIKRTSNTLLELVNDILFLSRLDARMIEFKPQPTDFALVFEGHCQMGWSKSLKPDVRTVVENPYNHLMVDIDDTYLGQVIEKLCANAAFYTTEGIIRVKYEYRGGQLTIAVEDSGQGLDAETLPHIFERFAFNRRDEHCGTGLVMPIVKELVEQMGGTIEIQSELNKGTTAWVTIPCEATEMDKKKEIVVS